MDSIGGVWGIDKRSGNEPGRSLPRTSDKGWPSMSIVTSSIDTIGAYLTASQRDPRLGRTTLHYIGDMIDYLGKAKVFEGIYGMDRQLDDSMAFFKGYAMSMERRLLLLVGPQGSGKTSPTSSATSTSPF